MRSLFPFSRQRGTIEEMPRQQLKDALDALHSELESAGKIDEADRAALLQAAQQIQDALGDADSVGEHDPDEPQSGRISALIEEFETSHPKFAEILGSVSEALANLGI